MPDPAQPGAVGFATAMPIDGYGPGFFRLGPHVFHGATLISPWGAGGWGGMTDAKAILTLAGRIDVLVLGQGGDIAPVPLAFRAALEGAGIGIEPMHTPAACRTYNLLLGEGRRVAAALLPVAAP